VADGHKFSAVRHLIWAGDFSIGWKTHIPNLHFALPCYRWSDRNLVEIFASRLSFSLFLRSCV